MSVIKSLEWLCFNFPLVAVPLDDSDRLSSCINLYCHSAINEINSLTEKVKELENEIKNLKTSKNS